jgi:hypothetical protein
MITKRRNISSINVSYGNSGKMARKIVSNKGAKINLFQNEGTGTLNTWWVTQGTRLPLTNNKVPKALEDRIIYSQKFRTLIPPEPNTNANRNKHALSIKIAKLAFSSETDRYINK